MFGNAANKIIMDGGGLIDPNRSVNLSRNIEVRAGGGFIRLWNASAATWSGSLSGTGNVSRTDMGTLNLSGDLSGYSGTFTQSGNAGIATNLTGSGTVGGNWTVSTGAITFNSASNQTATGTLSGSFVKSGAGTLTLSNTTVGGNWTINAGGGLAVSNSSAQSMVGILSGTGTFTKAGTGNLTASGASTLTGNILITGGTYTVNSTNNNSNPTSTALGNMTASGRTITTSTGATLSFNQPDAIGQYNYTSPVTLIADGGTITRIASANTFNSIGNLTLRNGGRLTTTNGNGPTVQSFAINGSVTVSGTAASFIDTLSGQTSNSGINLGTTSGSTTFDVADVTGNSAADLTVSASLQDKVLSGAAGLVKTGSGTVVMSGANTFTGNVTISGGSYDVNRTVNNTNPTATALGNMTTAGRTITTATGATLNFTQADAIGQYNYLTPVKIIADGGTITRQSAAGNYFNALGDVELRNGGRITTNTGLAGDNTVQSFALNGTLTVTGTAASFIDTVGSARNGVQLGYTTGTTSFDVGDVTGNSNVDLTVSAPLTDRVLGGAARLVKTGSGTMLTTVANSFSGGMTVRVGAVTTSNAGGFGTGSITVNDAGTGSANAALRINATSGGVTVSNAITIANEGTGAATLGSASTANSNQAVFSGVITLAKNVILDGGVAGDRLGFTGGIGGTGDVTVIGTNRVLFTGAQNSYAGATAIDAGAILQLGQGGNESTSYLPDTSAVTVNGTLRLAKGGNSETIGALAGSGGVAAVAGADTLVVGNGSGSGTFSGVLSNAGSVLAFTKSGAGVQSLTGANTYTGATSITGGRLQIGPTGSINSTSGVTVNGAGAELRYNATTSLTQPLTLTQGTLSGTGTIGTALVVGANAVIAPGNSPGTITGTAGVTWNPGGTYEFELNALSGTAGVQWDLVNVTAGGLNLSGLSTGSRFILDLITLDATNAPGELAVPYVAGQAFEMLFAGYNGLTVPSGFSTAAGSDLSELFTLDLTGWQGTQPTITDFSVLVNATGDGLVLSVAPVPEPGTVVLAGLGLGLAAWHGLRRRHTARRPPPRVS